MIIINKEIKKTPKVSIITATLNSEKYLEETLISFEKQTFKNFEIIIIDGKSTDNTINIIRKYENLISYCISEKDNGIYDAFNKGMNIAKGQYIGIVNSDDVLESKALYYLDQYDKKNPDIDFIFGSVKKHWGILYGYEPKKIKYSWGFYSSHSTGFYIKKKSMEKLGFYNTNYKYHADYDYFYRMIVHHKMKGISSKKEEVFGVFRRGGFSSSVGFKKKFYEEILIRYNNKQSILLILMIIFYRSLFNFKRFFTDR